MPEIIPAAVVEMLVQLNKKRAALLVELAQVQTQLAKAMNYAASGEKPCGITTDTSHIEYVEGVGAIVSDEKSELRWSAEFLSKKTGRPVAECMAFLQEDPFEGFDEMVEADLVSAREKPSGASFP